MEQNDYLKMSENGKIVFSCKKDCEGTVVIPEGVTRIWDDAFVAARALRKYISSIRILKTSRKHSRTLIHPTSQSMCPKARSRLIEIAYTIRVSRPSLKRNKVKHSNNRVGGKRSSFLPTFVFRPLTPPYVPFGIRRFLFWIPFEIRVQQVHIARPPQFII